MSVATKFRECWNGLSAYPNGCYVPGVGDFTQREVEAADRFLEKYRYRRDLGTVRAVALHLMRLGRLFGEEL